MRSTSRASRFALATATLLAACNPTTTASPSSGGSSGGGSTDKSSTVTFYHLLMTVASGSSSVTFKANGLPFGAGTFYLGTSLNNTVPWSSSSPLVPFEVTDGGTTRFAAQGHLLTNGIGHSAIAIGVNGSVDPNIQPAIVVAAKDTVTPPAGTARVRWVHAWPGVGAVDIWSGIPGAEVRVVQGLAYGQISPYSNITAATALISLNAIITPAGVARGVADYASIVAISQVTGGNAYLIPLIYINSNFGSPGSKSSGIYQER